MGAKSGITEQSTGGALGARTKEASALVYLVEELGDARMRCDQLLRYVERATKLIEKSSHKDHFFEVAGDLIRGIPETSFKLQKALQAVALAANRIDYEEIKQDLRPEKAEELERVLEDVRVRQVQRRSLPMVNPAKVVEQLRGLAKHARTDGQLDTEGLATLIASLEEGLPRVADNPGAKAAAQLDAMVHALEHPPEDQKPSRVRLAQALRKTLAEHLNVSAGETVPKETRDELEGARSSIKLILNGQGNPRRHAANAVALLARGLGLLGQEDVSEALEVAAQKVIRLWSKDVSDYEKTATDDEKRSRYEEGKSADPTENMSEEDAKAWKDNTDEHGDKFKKDADAENFDLGQSSYNPDAAALQLEESIASLKVLHRMLTGAAHMNPGNLSRHMKTVVGSLQLVAWNLSMPALSALLDKAKLSVRVKSAADETDEDEAFEKEAGAEDAQPRDLEILTGWLDNLAADAKLAVRYGKAGNYRKMFMNVMKAIADIYNICENFEVPGVSVLQRMTQKLLPYVSSKPSLKFGADEEKHSRYEEGKAADPTENMSEEDAKAWKENTDEHGDKFKTSARKMPKFQVGDIVKSDLDQPPPYHKGNGEITELHETHQRTGWLKVKWADRPEPEMSSAWGLKLVRRKRKSASGDDKQSRYEEGKSADPTENMSEEDAKAWKDNTDEHKDKFKSAAVDREAFGYNGRVYVEYTKGGHSRREGPLDPSLAKRRLVALLEDGSVSHVEIERRDKHAAAREKKPDPKVLKQLEDILVKERDYARSVAKEEAQNLWHKGTTPEQLKRQVQEYAKRTLSEIADILKSKGYDPKDAKKLHEESQMGSYELEEFMKNHKLEDHYKIQKKQASDEDWKAA